MLAWYLFSIILTLTLEPFAENATGSCRKAFLNGSCPATIETAGMLVEMAMGKIVGCTGAVLDSSTA
jgi:hypothetical protein